MNAGLIYRLALWMILTVLLVAGGIDGLLAATHAETISDWLRGHPHWFWIPAALMGLFLVGLGLHLFVFVD